MSSEEVVIIVEVAVVPEVWHEARCPACVHLGWGKSRRLIDYCGNSNHVKIRCGRCKSLILLLGSDLSIVEHGLQNPQQQKAIYSDKT